MRCFFRVVTHITINIIVVLSFFPSLWHHAVNPHDVNVPSGQFMTMLSIIIFLVIPLIPLPISSVLNRLLHPTNIPNSEEAEWTSLHLGNICASVVAYIVLFYPRDRDAARVFFDVDSALAHGVIVAEFLCILMAGLIANRCFQTWEAAGRCFFRIALNAIFTYFSLYYLSFISMALVFIVPWPVIIGLFAFLVPGILGYWWVYAMNDWLNMFDWARMEKQETFHSLLVGTNVAAIATLIQSFKIQNLSEFPDAWMNPFPGFIDYFPPFFTFLACLGMLVTAISFRIRRQKQAALRK